MHNIFIFNDFLLVEIRIWRSLFSRYPAATHRCDVLQCSISAHNKLIVNKVSTVRGADVTSGSIRFSVVI